MFEFFSWVRKLGYSLNQLLNTGILDRLDRTDNGRIIFPYEAVKVEFLLQADGGDMTAGRVAGGFSLPAPPLPACGSAPGGSQSLPGEEYL
jgi:hypothetical protein